MDVSVLTFIFLAALLALAAYLYERTRGPGGSDLQREVSQIHADMRLLGEQIASGSSVLHQRLEGIDTRVSHSQLQNADMVRDVFSTLADVKSDTRAVAEQAREFALLQDLLKAPKPRGGLGEAMLEELLRQVLPRRAFSTQYRFSAGVIVDAVVHMGDRLVCIDSKFPLSAYRQMCEAADGSERAAAERDFAADVDRHIRDIASRYVAPDEGTLDFAVMYVPAEGVYAEVLRLSHRRRSLFETAIEARVVPMSPLTLYGYLQTLLLGLKCLSIDKSAQEILGYCTRLGIEMERFVTDYETLGRHLTNARSKYEDGGRRLERFRAKLERVTDLEEGEGSPPLEVVAD